MSAAVWRERLRVHADALLSRDDAGFLAGWAAAWRTWAAPPEVDALAAALDGPAGATLEGLLQPCMRRALALDERAETDALLARRPPSAGRVRDAVQSAFGTATWDRVAEAATLVPLSARRHAVVVGGGPFPAAALWLRDETTIPSIDVLDVDEVAVERARRWATWCGDGRLRPRRADGATTTYDGADLVYVANQVTPKREVLARVLATAADDVVAVVREPVGLGRLLAERALAVPAPGWRVRAVGATHPTFLSRHVVLERA
ncbi:MAG: hypothetical protein IT460_01420 [Planctomycetes bacterium]|nr:hypothetical protein [Planctomycetota bacterium]